MYSGYAKYDWKNFRFVGVGTYGRLSETDLLYHLTLEHQGRAQVLGSEVYGALFEIGCDILSCFRKNKSFAHKKNWFFDSEEMKLPLFARYERLNTHHQTAAAFQTNTFRVNNLDVFTVGINFNPKENIVFKANYQFRNNRSRLPGLPKDSDLIEFGFGFIY